MTTQTQTPQTQAPQTITAVGKEQEWQPIETAPHPKGSPIKPIIGGNSDTEFVGECYWSELQQEFQCCGNPILLTHWMPLPTPPSLASLTVLPVEGVEGVEGKEGS